MFSDRNPCPTLRRGDKGHDVVRLQELLCREGFYPGPLDGYFGCETERAVVDLQKSEYLSANGVVSPDTWAVLGVNCGHDHHDKCPSRRCPPHSFAYKIKLGDTLYALSIKYRTSVNAIMRINPNINPNKLKEGQEICIPHPGRQ